MMQYKTESSEDKKNEVIDMNSQGGINFLKRMAGGA